MKNWTFRLFAIAAPLMLGGCLWGPGKFTSDLALRENGTFVLDYRGEIMLQIPDDQDADAGPWSERDAHCFVDGQTSNGPVLSVIAAGPDGKLNDGAPQPPKERDCTKDELAKLKSEHENRAQRKREERDQMARLFGMPGTDDESNRRFAANLMKYQGWRSASYKGKGVFEVDYHFEGRVGQDYVFPLMPESDLVIPFVEIRRRNDGSVMVTAPAFTGGQGPFGARAKLMGLPDKSDGPPSRAEGRFTITTDGEILTNNSEDGPVAGPSGKSVRWDISPASSKIPEMLVRL